MTSHPSLQRLRFPALLCVVVVGGLGLVSRLSPASEAAEKSAATATAIDFNRDIRPILSENCFACHGPDEKKRKARLRLDTEAGFHAETRGGGHVVVPGQPDESELLERVTAEEKYRMMPPPKFGKHLKPEEVALLKRWIEGGAKWSGHWAFVPPKRPELPVVADATWPKNPIDFFILERLEREGLRPEAEADRTTLIRRVTFDLTGMPPTPEEVDAFLEDRSPDAYEKVVDRLLRSPRFGEHRARIWLDAARYGDTHGLHLDNYREMWPYRDWVVRAFNNNLPFDRFVVEQLAGDLLPNPTLDQQVASGFNRCHVTTSEGGSIEEECYVRNVVDRVETTGIVFLGLTVGCARCHDHKYDPVTMKDFYSLFAFFNSLDNKALDGNAAKYPPIIKVPSAEQTAALDKLQAEATTLREKIGAEVKKVKYDDAPDARESEVVRRDDYVWIDDALPAASKAETGGANVAWEAVTPPQDPVLSGTTAWVLSATDMQQLVVSEVKPPLRVGAGDVLFAHVFLDPTDPPREIMLQWRTGEWKSRAYWGENLINYGKDKSAERASMGPLPTTGKWVRLEVPAAKVGLKPGTLVDGLAFTQHGGTAYWDRAGIETWTPQGAGPLDTLTSWIRRVKAGGDPQVPKELQDITKLRRTKRSAEQKQKLVEYFVEHAWVKTRPVFDPMHQRLVAIDREQKQIDQATATTLVSSEQAKPREAFILKRGEYDQRGDKVDRATPAFLPPLPADAPRDRLGLARWFVSKDQPLTSRVAVNRFWQQVFGTGLVKTAEDFGSQGDPPSHPELLDWLAVQFQEGGWDVKKTFRRIVTSATYRQASRVTPEKLARDPNNRLLARGPRFRLDAEMLRDQALAVSGLLVERLGGPGVKPPQPPGLWEAVGYTSSNTARFSPDKGNEKVHRRSLYTFWKRTAPPPQMSIIDAPSREACMVRRERTNTPLQALLLLNETQYVEAARALAERSMREGGDTPEARLNYMFRLATSRRPAADELNELLGALRDLRAEYVGNVESARKLIAVGESKPDPQLDPVDLAAYTMVANLLLNLDEVLNKG